MNKSFRYLLFTVTAILFLVACESAVSPAPQEFIFEAEAADINPGTASAEELSLQGEPRVFSDEAARGGKAFYFLRNGDTLTWKLRNRPQGTFRVIVKARGMMYEGAPELELYAGNKRIKKLVKNAEYADVSFGNWYFADEADLSLRFTNDKWGGTWETDRNVIVDFVRLVPVDSNAGSDGSESSPENPKDPQDEGKPNTSPSPTPNNETPALLRDYHTLRTAGNSTYKRFGKVTYIPYNQNGWDKLEFLDGEVRDSNLPDFLSFNLNRDARIAVIWQGGQIPSWLASWREVNHNGQDRRFEKGFKQSQTVKLGGGGGNGVYYVLLAEANGTAPKPPALPKGISERPVPNELCPAWVHDRYVAEHPTEKKLYRTWHPAIDPVYWCHFGHEHGSDPALVGYTPYFGYTADKNNNQDERHEGFKGFAFRNGDTDWYFNAHFTSGLASRVCAQTHTVVVAALRDGEMLAELSFKADFGEAKINQPTGQGDSLITNRNCPQAPIEAEGSPARKLLRIVGQDNIKDAGYEQWRFAGHPFLGLDFEPGLGSNVFFDTRNPVTGCDGLRCERLLPTIYTPGMEGVNGGEVNGGDVRTIAFQGNPLTLTYSRERDLTDGVEDGYFYTDAKGTRFMDPDHPDATQQYVKNLGNPLVIRAGKNEKYGTTEAWRGMYFEGVEKHNAAFLLGGLLGPMN